MNCFKNKIRSTQFVRKNGWMRPLHYLQVLAWIILIMFGLMSFGVEILALPPNGWVAGYLCIGGAYILLVTTMALATSVNPADDGSIQRFENSTKPIPSFDRTVHQHVIENNFCHICEVSVQPQSKHCSACNKCVAVFDHHCKWLNNCVGRKNYRSFFLMLVTALLGAVGMFIISTFVFVNSLQNFYGLNEDVWWRQLRGGETTFIVLIAIKMLMLLASLALLLQLFVFHLLLFSKDLTTYAYIIRREEKKAKKANDDRARRPAPEAGQVRQSLSDEMSMPACSSGPNEQLPVSTEGNYLQRGPLAGDQTPWSLFRHRERKPRVERTKSSVCSKRVEQAGKQDIRHDSAHLGVFIKKNPVAAQGVV